MSLQSAEEVLVMATRILGPTGSKRRKRFLLGPILLAAALTALFVAGGARAVHDYGVFQLDGNALTSAQSTPPASDDWDKVCHQVTVTDDPNPPNAIPDQCTSPNPGDTTGAVATSWVAELSRNASLFVGGGSKDPLNVDQWAWKDGAGGLPDKDNLEHAFAARYNVAGVAGTDCVVGTTCDVLYFGSDRFDNSGDAQQGFWFLQNACDLGSNKVGGATGFACSDPTPNSDPSDDFHRNG